MPKSRKPRKASRKASRKGKKCPPGCVKKTLKRSRKSTKRSRRRVSRKASRKRKSVKRKASRKRRSVKRKASRKRRSVKRKASRKRKSVKRKASRKRKSVKRKASRKRKSVKRKASRKRKSVKRKASRKRRSAKKKASRKRKSAKKKASRKRKSAKKKASRKRKSAKKKASRKRRSVKRKASRKRRSVKRKASRKRRSVKRKASRKRRSVKKSHKFRLSISNPFSAIRDWHRTRRANAGFEKNLKARRKVKARRFREDLLTVIGRLHKGLPKETYMEVAELFIEGAHGLSSSQRNSAMAKLKAGKKIDLSPDYARRYYGSGFTKEQYQKANNRRIAAVWKYYFKTKHKESDTGLSRDAFISYHKEELRESQKSKVRGIFHSKLSPRLVKNWKDINRKAAKAKYVKEQRIAQWNKTSLPEKYKKCKEYTKNSLHSKNPGVAKDARHHYATHNCKDVIKGFTRMNKHKQTIKQVVAPAAAAAGRCQKIKKKYNEIKNNRNRTKGERKEGDALFQKFKQENCSAILPKKPPSRIQGPTRRQPAHIQRNYFSP